MMNLIKQYKTNSGRPVLLYAIHPHQIHGAIMFDDEWESEWWFPNGRYDIDNGASSGMLDLVEIKVTGPGHSSSNSMNDSDRAAKANYKEETGEEPIA